MDDKATAEGLKAGQLGAMVYVYAHGLVHCSACAPAAMGPEEVAAEVNRLHPTGISSPWQHSTDPEFANGGPNPSPCDQEPDARRHWLMAC
jgi:hypothetical protein